MKHILLAICLLAAPALADNPPMSMKVFDEGTRTGTLCSAQTATSTGCTGVVNGVSDQLVLALHGYSQIALYSNQSTATTYTCDAYTSDNGYDADSGVGQDRTTTAITETQEMVSLDGALGFLWIECSGIADNQVTITFVARK